MLFSIGFIGTLTGQCLPSELIRFFENKRWKSCPENVDRTQSIEPASLSINFLDPSLGYPHKDCDLFSAENEISAVPGVVPGIFNEIKEEGSGLF